MSTAVVRVEAEVAWALAPQPKRGQALPELDLCRKQPAAQRVAQLSPSSTVNGFQRATLICQTSRQPFNQVLIALTLIYCSLQRVGVVFLRKNE